MSDMLTYLKKRGVELPEVFASYDINGNTSAEFAYHYKARVEELLSSVDAPEELSILSVKECLKAQIKNVVDKEQTDRVIEEFSRAICAKFGKPR